MCCTELPRNNIGRYLDMYLFLKRKLKQEMMNYVSKSTNLGCEPQEVIRYREGKEKGSSRLPLIKLFRHKI